MKQLHGYCFQLVQRCSEKEIREKHFTDFTVERESDER